MNVSQVLRKLKVRLSAQYNFAEATLVDGAEVYSEAEEFVPGAILFVRSGEGVSEDPFAPAGKHETTDGKIITVGENGVIEAVEEKPAEVAEEAMEEVEVEVPVAEEAIPATEELLTGIAELIAPFTEEIATLTEEVVALKKRFEKMAAEPAASKVKSSFSAKKENLNPIAHGRFEAIMNLQKSKK